MKRRRLFTFGLDGHRPKQPPVIDYNPVHKARCPFCRSLATLYIPVIAEGHCDSCGKAWRFLADPDAGFERPTIRPRRIDYRDLVGFCITVRRGGEVKSVDDAIERFRRLGVVVPDRDAFERAWKDASHFV